MESDTVRHVTLLQVPNVQNIIHIIKKTKKIKYSKKQKIKYNKKTIK